MGFFDRFRRKATIQPEPPEPKRNDVYVGAKNDDPDRKDYQSYNN